MRFDSRVFHSVVYDFCFKNFVEGLDIHYEVTNYFTDVADVNPFVPKELIDGPSQKYQDSFQIYPCQEYLHVKYWSEEVGAHLFVQKP